MARRLPRLGTNPRLVIDLFRGEHFDGVFGFSQGAALAGLRAAVQDSDPDAGLRFDFAVMVGGFTSFEPQHAPLFSHKLVLPSVHVAGSADGIVPIRDSLALAERFAEPTVLKHAGGHVIPSDRSIVSQVAQFIATAGTSVPASRPGNGPADA